MRARTKVAMGRRRGPRSCGVTLMEILVVLAIIMILASLTIASISILKTKAKRNAAESLLNGLSLAIEQFEADNPPGHIKDTDGPYLPADPYHGIKNLRVALSGEYKCPNCGYVYDPYHYAENDVDTDGNPGLVIPFQNLPNDWECPDCRTEGDETLKDRFVRGKNYIEWITPDKIGHGIVELDLNHDGDTDDSGEKNINVWGAILDPWGQPLIYYSQFDKTELPDEWRAKFPQLVKDNELLLSVAGQYVLDSYGPD